MPTESVDRNRPPGGSRLLAAVAGMALATVGGPLWADAGPELRAKYDEAKQRLIVSRTQLRVALAADDVDGIRQAAVLGRQSRELLEAVERDAIQHQAQLRLQQGALIAEVERLMKTAESELRATESLRPYPSVPSTT